jgi:hypothetical protein
MGYAPASARNPAGSPSQIGAVQNQTNVFVLGQDDLAQARELMRAAGQLPSLGVPPAVPSGQVFDMEVEVVPVPAAG